jgi:hypothetical protein
VLSPRLGCVVSPPMVPPLETCVCARVAGLQLHSPTCAPPFLMRRNGIRAKCAVSLKQPVLARWHHACYW